MQIPLFKQSTNSGLEIDLVAMHESAYVAQPINDTSIVTFDNKKYISYPDFFKIEFA